MGTFFGIFLTVLAVAWMVVNVVRSVWSDAGEATENVTFIGVMTGLGSFLTMRKMKKTSRDLEPKVGNVRKAVNSLIRRG
jgi:hypothetical protein|tara:strand:- start:289 stop:528 length:240 start_codon:yes stop_codon:yes gene_type:complete